MLILVLFTLSTLVLAFSIMIFSSLLAKKSILDREKNSPFECGFDPKGSARLPFSLRFFLIAVIFLIFDVEITLLLPLVPISYLTNLISITQTGFFFFIILLLGLYHEWNQGALEWAD
uniref:NADH-ubiquinone oxidoreductase chain 3 n=1 Tax=Lysmata boggessi TaxID=497604 RepID=A0A8F5H6F9_9EUCA|nr:NADH dehydrogenase subunit 3 [Lysmata boggessi]QVT15580.1 NADH dehydrogenase subunit 3 [Lysmata boggessi]QXJ42672.1 NADH dehydrogenase subunit 3 [Lysmata boggessi]